MKAVVAYIGQNQKRFIQDLNQCLRIPSVSSQTKRKNEVKRCAAFLKKEFLRIGFHKAEVQPTKGHPAVYAEWKHPEPGKPTVLIYGHYDVQPEDPLEEWNSPPFEPTQRGRELFGRGVIDDKGQVYIHMKALEAHLKVNKKLPLNVKFMVEGEEEIGSPNLESYLQQKKRQFKSDFMIISDTPMLKKGIPSICYGLRGLSYMEIDVIGPFQDLHSGGWGGVVANPANVLAEIISKLKDKNGKILIPGFYKDVKPLTKLERKQLRSLPVKIEEYRKMAQVPSLISEKGYSYLESVWGRPTLDVNGIQSGYTGEGAKTIIPKSPKAKSSMRLVPNQNFKKVAKQFTQYVQKIAPKSVKVKVNNLAGGDPYYANINHPVYEAAMRALEKGFGKKPVFIREGGSIPFVNSMERILNKPALLLGFGLPDENAHAPNEKLNLDNFHRGMVSCAYLYEELAKKS